MISIQKTTVDWLRFRVRENPPEVLEKIRPLYGDLGHLVTLKQEPRGGILGFRSGCSIMLADMALGRMDYGGDSQRGWVRVDLPAKGCEWVRDWDAVDGLESMDSAQIRRLDIALTTWDGEVTHERVVSAHKAGRFTTRGRPPERREITSSNQRAGRTCYVGKRDSDKFFRAYEKGYELAAKAGPLAGGITHIDGKRVEDIYRCELELKDKGTPVPWEVIDRRDHYFAGAYPFCAEVLPGVDADILMRRPERAPQLELKAALANCRIQYGNVLYTALRAYHGDYLAVWDQVVGDRHCEHLRRSGVLQVDHG